MPRTPFREFGGRGARLRHIAPRRVGHERVSLLASQGLNAASSFLAAALVARVATVETFGRFTLAMLCYMLLSMSFRSTIGQMLLLDHGEGRKDRRAGSRRAAVALGLVSGCAALLSQSVGGVRLPTVGILVGIGLPIMALQDWYRYVLMAEHKARAVAVVDLVWLWVMVVTFAGLSATSHATVGFAVGAWVVGAVPSLAVAAAFAGRMGHSIGGWRWVKAERQSLQPLVWETLVTLGSAAGVLYLVAWIAGIESVGEFRAGQLAIAPAITLCLTLQVVALRDAAGADTPTTARRAVVLLPVVGSVAIGAWLLVLRLLPATVGRQILGDSWLPARAVMLPLSVALAISLVTAARVSLIKALQSTQMAWRVRARVFWAEPVLGSIGAGIGGVQGAAWFLVFAQLVILVSALLPVRDAGPESRGLDWDLAKVCGDEPLPGTWNRRRRTG